MSINPLMVKSYRRFVSPVYYAADGGSKTYALYNNTSHTHVTLLHYGVYTEKENESATIISAAHTRRRRIAPTASVATCWTLGRTHTNTHNVYTTPEHQVHKPINRTRRLATDDDELPTSITAAAATTSTPVFSRLVKSVCAPKTPISYRHRRRHRRVTNGISKLFLFFFIDFSVLFVFFVLFVRRVSSSRHVTTMTTTTNVIIKEKKTLFTDGKFP